MSKIQLDRTKQENVNKKSGRGNNGNMMMDRSLEVNPTANGRNQGCHINCKPS
jgi:hypothetical protein